MTLAATETYDVAIVGAGPAGSIAARSLAGSGRSVLLIDRARFPRPKVCGCCLNPRALDALTRAGLGELPTRLGAVPLGSFELGANGRRAVLRHDLGVALSRDAMDLALIDAARDAGATVLTETTASLVGARTLRLDAGGTERFASASSIIAANGLADSFREHVAGEPERLVFEPESRIGAGAVAPRIPRGYEPGRIYMASGIRGYVGLVGLEDGRFDIAAAFRPEAVKAAGGLGHLAARILETAGFPGVPGIADLAWKGTPPLTRRAVTLASAGVFRVGDAAGYVEPFTGEGMAWALDGGLELARILHEALGRADLASAETAERRWRRAYRGRIARSQVVCKLAKLAMRTPWMTSAMVRVLGVCPGAARPFLRSMHRPRLGAAV